LSFLYIYNKNQMKPNNFPLRPSLDGSEEIYTQTSGISEKFTLNDVKTFSSQTLQEVLDNNHDLVNGNNFQGTGAGVGNTGTEVIGIGSLAAFQNTGNEVTAIGINSALENIASVVNAIGGGAAFQNSGEGLNEIGVGAGYQNAADQVNCIGSSSGRENEGNFVNAIGNQTAYQNTGDNVNSIGNGTASLNTGNNVNAIGVNAARQNTGNNIIALGTDVGVANPLSGMFIISNSELPSFADHAAAIAAISPTGIVGNTYIYHNQATNSIGAVRLI
jgi:hypothetical protein